MSKRNHRFINAPLLGKQFCANCGLIALNNKFTQWCIDKGCDYEDSPNYKNTRKRLTKLKF